MVKKQKILGNKLCDVSSNCGIDFYSLGHILFGFLAYIIMAFLFSLLGVTDVWVFIFLTQSIGLAWEFLENYILIDTKFKFQNKRDCLLNSLFDIVFVTGGGFLGMFIYPIFWLAIMISSILFLGFKFWERYLIELECIEN